MPPLSADKYTWLERHRTNIHLVISRMLPGAGNQDDGWSGICGEIVPPKPARNQELSGASLPRLWLDPDRIQEVEEHLPVALGIGRHRGMEVHPVPISDEMAGEVALLCCPSCSMELHREFEPREPVALGAVQEFGRGQVGTPVPPVRLAARLGDDDPILGVIPGGVAGCCLRVDRRLSKTGLRARGGRGNSLPERREGRPSHLGAYHFQEDSVLYGTGAE